MEKKKILKLPKREIPNAQEAATPDAGLAKAIQERFGRMPDARITEKDAILPIPRNSITDSHIAVKWMNDLIVDFENDKADSKMLEALKGVYLVFRDCSLMAKHYLGFMDAQSPRNRQNDVALRFTMNKQDQVMMEVGYMPKKKDGQ